ncbi:MAG TPA: SDR family oxidoreductase [Steroidobacteraceae bacterium]
MARDIQDEIFCTGLVNSAVAQLGGLDILVNNAARRTAQDSVFDITTEQLDATYKTNVYAMFWITKTALKYMTAGAAIINTTSSSAYDPSQDLLDYASTKAAIAIFTKGLAKQVASKEIRVNAVAPGPIWTPLQLCRGQSPAKPAQFGAAGGSGGP